MTIQREFMTQIFKTKDQWESGLSYRLNFEKDEGITLFSVLTFTKWIGEPDDKMYLFCWNKIPGKDETLLKEFLMYNFSIDWIATAEIQKINENTIKLFIDNKYVLLHLINEKTKVDLFISDNRKHELIAKEEKGRVNIFAKMNPAAVALDECGLVYVLDSTSCKFYCYDVLSGKRIGTSCIGGCGKDIGKFYDPKKIIFDTYTLWVLDMGNKRLQGFSRENYQIKYVIDKFIGDNNIPEYIKNPVDFIMDKKGNIYILDLRGYKNSKILKYDNHGIQIKLPQSCFKELNEPLSLTVGKENILYILDKKCKNGEDKGFKACILKFSDEGKYLGYIDLAIPVDNESNQYQDFVPSIITIDKNGIFFIADAEFIYQFAPDGSFIGTVQIPGLKDEITGIAVDNKNNLYVSCNKGIASFSMQSRFTKEKGYFYSRTLDNGKEKSQWHGLSLEGNIPPKAVIEVYYYSVNDLNLKESIDKIISDPEKSIINKRISIENIINNKWIGPEILSISEKSGKKPNTLNDEILYLEQKTRLDMLFRENTGRYLWVKIALSTVDENLSPSIDQMKVFYPRKSYLGYLPAIYQENPIGQDDPVSKDFLERFLSIFETVFYDLETRIYDIYKYFDPDTVDSKLFLNWLASWLNIAIEDKWDENIKRTFIRDAYTLYKQKGTLAGIEKLIEIYTGKKPLIREPSRIGKPMILNDKGTFRLGINSLLLKTPVRGFRLGEDSILGRAALIDGDIFEVSGNPYSISHWFTVVLDLSLKDNTFDENMLKRILDREKPAHTMYNLIFTGDMKGGSEVYVGMNTMMPDQEHFILGDNSIIGSGILMMGGEHAGKVELHSKVEKDAELT
ncbi:MAG: hypothetical protein J5U17_05480 [Candidatus Methanoperedens sp.]|nr:hypothetical protein [Candidatus Methanoperedens sp.]